MSRDGVPGDGVAAPRPGARVVEGAPFTLADAPLGPDGGKQALLAREPLTRGQRRILMIIVAVAALSLIFFAEPAFIVMASAFSLFCLAVLALRATLLMAALGRRRAPLPAMPPDVDLPIFTVLCPLYREAESVPNLLASLKLLDYPSDRLDFKCVLEADDAATFHAVATAATAAALALDIVIVPKGGPRTKPRALNAALAHARGTLLVIYDAEDRPEPDQLRKAAAAMAAGPPTLVCLQARLNYYNRKTSWITRLFAIEYALLFDLVLPGLVRLGAPVPLGGTSNIFRTAALRAVHGWDDFNVTEDADLGLRLAAAGGRVGMLDSTTYEEATDRIGPWVRQRTRWIKGYLQTWLVHMRPGLRPAHWRGQVTLHLIVGGVVVAALLNPIFWALYCWWIVTGATIVLPPLVAALGVAALLAGNLFHLWLFLLAPTRRGWHDLVPIALTAPIYWILQSVAGYCAVWQFIRRPHYWAKTAHSRGLPPARVAARVR